MFFSQKFADTLKRSQLGYDIERYSTITFVFSFFFSILISGFIFFIFMRLHVNTNYAIVSFPMLFLLFFLLIKSIPTFMVKNAKIVLESDLLYSARHLLLKLESGSSLINSLESVANLRTKSSYYFKEIVYDISLGLPVEDAIEKAIEYSPSSALTRIIEEIESSLKTGGDIRKSLRSTLDDVTKQHLIQIQEYGRKLNPMTMFYMIIGTIIPSMGTAILVVISSLGLVELIIDIRILMALASLLLVVQVFFILAFRSLKPAVMD